MPQGLQVFDESGNLVVDTSTYVYKEIYVQDVTSDGDYTVPAQYAGSSIMATSNVDPAEESLDLVVDAPTNKVYWRFGGGGGSGNARIRVAIV